MAAARFVARSTFVAQHSQATLERLQRLLSNVCLLAMDKDLLSWVSSGPRLEHNSDEQTYVNIT